MPYFLPQALRIKFAYISAWQELCDTQPQARCDRDVVESLIPTLHAFNATRFNTIAGITACLNTLQPLIEDNHRRARWEAFLDLAERPGKNSNFGTWAI
jgi:hypothetical protein